MPGALCREPDPADPTHEGCILPEGHEPTVRHMWLGGPCRHFRSELSSAGQVCAMCHEPLEQALADTTTRQEHP